MLDTGIIDKKTLVDAYNRLGELFDETETVDYLEKYANSIKEEIEKIKTDCKLNEKASSLTLYILNNKLLDVERRIKKRKIL